MWQLKHIYLIFVSPNFLLEAIQYKRENWLTNRIESGPAIYTKIQVSKEMIYLGAGWKEHWPGVFVCHYFLCFGGQCTWEELPCLPPLLFLLGGKNLTMSVAIYHTWGAPVPISCCLPSCWIITFAYKEPTLPTAPRTELNCMPPTVTYSAWQDSLLAESLS